LARAFVRELPGSVPGCRSYALEQRAVKQQERLERQRMQTACEVFATN